MNGFPFDAARSRGTDSDDDRILPLINVVFLLLIFFMIVGSVTQADPFDIEPPRSDAEQGAAEDGTTVHVAADGRLSVGGTAVELTDLVEGLGAPAGGARSAPVRIKADGGVEATRLVAVMEALREAGVESVRLLTIQRES